ncbi:recombinase family protein [Candidatus Saccharibacteria bacterium]|nr:recombinase family protein [Candidatus Saccharibacteria bacterium]
MNLKPEIEIIEAVHPLGTEIFERNVRKLRVAAYARVSTEQDEQQNSYEAQVEFYTNYINSNSDWIFVGVFADRGVTGTNTKNRENFNEMIDLALNGGVDLILTKSISRFARNTVDTLSIVRQLKAVGVEVVFEKENLHTFDPKCEMMLTIMSSLAQEESRSISENVRWGQRKSMQDGKIHLAYSHFLGYRKGADGRPEIVEEEATIVREIYSMYIAGKSIRNIADHLTSKGILTPAGRTQWSVSTIRSILSNEKYKGEALLQKTYTVDYLTKEVRKNNGEVPSVRVRNSHEAIIDPDTFDMVQELLKKRTKTRAKFFSRHPFAGRIICGDCGGVYGHKVWRVRSSGERYNVWYCNHKYDGEPCKTPCLKEDDVKVLFVQMLEERRQTGFKHSDKLWLELVDHLTVYNDGRIVFNLSDGEQVELTM